MMSERAKGTVKQARVTWQGEKAFEARAGSGHAIRLDADREKNTGLSPMELLLMSLGGCTGTDVVNILLKKRIKLKGYEVEVEGEQAVDYPKVYTKIKVTHILKGKDIPARAVAEAIRLSETKYCSAAAMLAKTARIETSYRIENA
jgi:putative redox protein